MLANLYLLATTTLPATAPTSSPSGWPPSWVRNLPIDLNDPFTQRILLAVAAFIVLLILLRMIGRMREKAANRRRSAETRRGFDELRLQQEEIRRLAEQIVATSSTSRIAGYVIVRQVETVFTEGRPSSGAAMEFLKGLAAQKGANALINVQTRQTPSGKWVAGGDAVVVRMLGRRGPQTAAPPNPDQGT